VRHRRHGRGFRGGDQFAHRRADPRHGLPLSGRVLRGGGDRRGGVVSRGDHRRHHRRRDPQPDRHDQSAVFGRHAVHRHGARADLPPAGPHGTGGTGMNSAQSTTATAGAGTAMQQPAAHNTGGAMRRSLPEMLVGLGLLVAPFILPALGMSPDLLTRILIWGLFGLGFDLLFGYTGLLSFGQAAFYGTAGFVTAYLLTDGVVPNMLLALAIGTVAAAAMGLIIGYL